MSRRKKMLLALSLGIVLIAASISGVALAADGEETESPRETLDNFTDRLIEVYYDKTGVTIDKEILKASYDQACEELGNPPRMRFHFGPFTDDELTQEQRDELKAWMESRPEFPTDELKEWIESRPEFPTDDLEEWMESKPDFLTDEFKEWLGQQPDGMPFEFGKRDKAGFHGMRIPRLPGGEAMFGCYDSPEES